MRPPHLSVADGGVIIVLYCTETCIFMSLNELMNFVIDVYLCLRFCFSIFSVTEMLRCPAVLNKKSQGAEVLGLHCLKEHKISYLHCGSNYIFIINSYMKYNIKMKREKIKIQKIKSHARNMKN